jgi:serine/threonine protein kinase/tetratricopeptide (TPR) repeat protein
MAALGAQPGEEKSPPRVLGRYRILSVLGQGGMGVVYRGEHLETRELAAIKTIHTVSEQRLAGIRRETHALGRVRHPGVVRIVAEGVAGGLPWYAMELLEGRTLRDFLAQPAPGASTATVTVAQPHGVTITRAPSLTPAELRACEDRQAARSATHSGPPLDELLRIVHRLCAPLSYLHASGLVHRDLKPDNVFVRPDGAPVLVDLGIAGRFAGADGREELDLDLAGTVAGTAAYMAPEQIRGEPLDARADLYSLGCVLYECATGAPPFTGTEARSILKAHLSERPVPPSHRVDGVPGELDRLILHLLQKRPQDRLGYADDIARALVALGVPGAEEPAAAGRRPYLYRPDFVGRDGVLRALDEAIARAAEERRGGRIYLGGESGAGKTRLAMEAVRAAARRGMAVAVGQCAALSLSGRASAALKAGPLHPFAPVLLAVADRCREMGAAETARIVGPRGKLLAAYQPALADLPGQRDLPEPAPLDPEAARARVLAALATTLFAFAEHRPLLVVIDDLQWADELSQSFLCTLSEADLDARGLLFVSTYRLEETDRALEAILRANGARRIELGRLGADEVGAMACGMLALREAPAQLVGLLDHACNGNPFFVAEYLRTAIAEGLLTRDAEGRWRLGARGELVDSLGGSLPLPRGLTELIERRLSALPGEVRALLDAAVVLGREFEGDVALETAGVESSAGMDALATLRERHVVEESAGGRLSFVHDKIREIAYARILGEARRRLHLRAAEAIERRAPSSGAPGLDATLAHHFASALVHDRGAAHFARAGDQARRALSTRDAIALYRSAMREAEQIPGREADPRWREQIVSLGERLGDVLALGGDHEEAQHAFQGALAGVAVENRARRARLHRKIGEAWESHHRHHEALGAYAEAEAALGEAPGQEEAVWWEEWVQLHIDRVSVSYWLAEVDRIPVLLDRLRPTLESRGTPLQRARFFEALVQPGLWRERYQASRETLDFARAFVRASEATGDANEIAESACTLGCVLLWHGSLAEAQVKIQGALAEATRIGNMTLRSRALAYLAQLARMRGEQRETRQLAAQGLAAAEAARMINYIGVARANLAWVARREGQMDAAEREGEEALSLWRQIPLVFPFHWLARLPLSAVALSRDRSEAAMDHARALSSAKQQRLPAPVTSLLERAIAQWDRAQPGRARRTLERAMKIAEQAGYA